MRWHNETDGAVTALHAALRTYPAGEHRSRALTLALLAQLLLDMGQFTDARTMWRRALTGYPHLRSARTTAALTTVGQRLSRVGNPGTARQRCFPAKRGKGRKH
ncbi:hypothetical protein ATK36_4845 [Amycolatopsis sulphurea]|uniref:Tetratricopeptide repeat protein n=1 Tax=Amycolatopsis sulphurea TaxID=76022 RepID=A0A2A9FGW1_9PSEU|nr:hypothetical protein [Amycolatopsis sulphurea]PFG49675.1 hypothetical protein ATK36_4845 [Amycolatopsis sulphurea]